jgi:hypothetical protein
MNKLTLYSPAAYKITVKGAPLGYDNHPFLADNAVIEVVGEGDDLHSSISLTVKDQAELTGVLNALYTMHCVILVVENLESQHVLKNAEQSNDEGAIG